jgi:hypothetical protein
VAIVIILAVIVLGIVVISVVSSRRFEKRVEGYSGMSREAFIKHFSTQEVPSTVSGTVYDTFKAKVKSEKFMPSPEMSIEQVFEQLGEDTDDDARHILKVLGIPKPTDNTLEAWPGRGVQTVSDMVLWTDWVRRHQ